MQMWKICSTWGVESRRMNDRREKLAPKTGGKWFEWAAVCPKGQIAEEIWEVNPGICCEYLMPVWIMHVSPPRASDGRIMGKGFLPLYLFRRVPSRGPVSESCLLWSGGGVLWSLMCTSGITYSVGKRF